MLTRFDDEDHQDLAKCEFNQPIARRTSTKRSEQRSDPWLSRDRGVLCDADLECNFLLGRLTQSAGIDRWINAAPQAKWPTITH